MDGAQLADFSKMAAAAWGVLFQQLIGGCGGPQPGNRFVSCRVVRAVRAGEAKLRGRIGDGRRNAGASDGSVSCSFSFFSCSGGCFPVTMFRGF